MKYRLIFLFFAFLLSGCSILYNKKYNEENHYFKKSNLPSYTVNIFISDLNGLSNYRVKRYGFILFYKGSDIYLGRRAWGKHCYSRDAFIINAITGEPRESCISKSELNRLDSIPLMPSKEKCRSRCTFVAHSKKHNLALALYDGQAYGISHNADLFIEVVDYSSVVAAFKSKLGSGEIEHLSNIRLPLPLLPNKAIKSFISDNKSDPQKLTKLAGQLQALGEDAYEPTIQRVSNTAEFRKSLKLAQTGSIEEQVSFLKANGFPLSKSNCYFTNATALNVRQGRYTSSKVVGKLKQGEVVCLEKERSGWGKLGNKNGWVSLAFLSRKPVTKNNQLLVAFRKEVDRNLYAMAAKRNAFESYQHYLSTSPKGEYIKESKAGLKRLYMQQSSFNGFMEAYRISPERELLHEAKKSLATKAGQYLEPNLVDIYFSKMVLHRSSIPSFVTLISQSKNIDYRDYSSQLMKLNGVVKSFQPSDFLNSIEYKYVLSNFSPKVTAHYKYGKALLTLDYKGSRIAIEQEAKCDYQTSKTGTRNRGAIESLFSLNFDDKESYTYDVFACHLTDSKLNNVKEMLVAIGSYHRTDSLAKLANNWKATQRTGSYTYTSGSSGSSSSSQKYNWQYTVECRGTTFSGIPKRSYSGVITNSTHADAYSAAQKLQSRKSCYQRFGNGYTGEGYLELEISN
ncbi:MULTISPECIES: SH3 domain-containing protein [unclassified Pseudoalteromonas]|uniref:SH3 domain-containing protein n=1 Tax=unclassified Pseudoalteromonas TaxID=194690 RepID=UPI003014F497